MRFVFRVLYDAFMRFSQDDGWAIASHIALSILTSLFPFLIFVTALAGFLGSKNLGDEGVQILFQTWPQQVATPIANEIHNVLTQTRSGVLTIGVILSIYFSSSGVEAVRIGLNRAYDVKDSRPWWLLRLESIAYVFVGAFSLLTLAFLVVLAPLIWAAVLHFAPGLEPLTDHRRPLRDRKFGASAGACPLTQIPPSRAKIAAGDCTRDLADLRTMDRGGHCLRLVPRPIRAQLRYHLRGSRVGDDRTRLSLHDRFHFHLRRRIERGHPAGKTQERRKYEGSTSYARKLVTARGEWRYPGRCPA
jgi:hypothetical protein